MLNGLKGFKISAWRLIYLLSVFAFFLPFVSVKGCKSEITTNYSGFSLITQKDEGSLLYLFPIGMGLLFLAGSFLALSISDINKAFLKGVKTIVGFLSCLIVISYPSFQFFFSTVKPKMGQIIGGACWIIIYSFSYFTLLRKLFIIKPLPSLKSSQNFFVTQAFYYLLGIFACWCPILMVVFAKTYSYSFGEFFIALAATFLLSLPVFFTLHFLVEGVKNEERWAVIISNIALFFIFAGSLILRAVNTDNLWKNIGMGMAVFTFLVLLIPWTQYLIKKRRVNN